MKIIIALLIAVSLVLGLFACAKPATEELPEVVLKTPGHEKWEEKIDYSDSNNWLSIPGLLNPNYSRNLFFIE